MYLCKLNHLITERRHPVLYPRYGVANRIAPYKIKIIFSRNLNVVQNYFLNECKISRILENFDSNIFYYRYDFIFTMF